MVLLPFSFLFFTLQTDSGSA